MSTHTTTISLLILPPEIRKEIYLLYFRSLTIKLYTPPRQGLTPNFHETPLALLESCRQIYLEAEPLVLPNVLIRCTSNSNLIELLTRIGPARIPQLRYMIVDYRPIGFALRPNVEQLQRRAAGATDNDLYEGHNSKAAADYHSPYYKQLVESHRFFHTGAILGLFPGLQLDLLQVLGGPEADSFTEHQNTDCFSSLLEADGYRRIWMEATGDDPLWRRTQSTDTWELSIATKFKPHAGWKVKIVVDDQDWKARECNYWREIQDMGITLAEKAPSDPSEVWSCGFKSEAAADIVIDRGDADVAVKMNDNRILKCIQRSYRTETPEYYKEASDDLRYLFNTCSWKTIKNLDGYQDGWW